MVLKRDYREVRENLTLTKPISMGMLDPNSFTVGGSEPKKKI